MTTTDRNYDLYLALAETPHGKRYWIACKDPQASVSPEDLRRTLGPATVGTDGYETEAEAAEMLADQASIDLDDPETWDECIHHNDPIL